MNGEKAAYVSPVFSNKRQRTLESLISGLQNDQWLKPEVCLSFTFLLFNNLFLFLFVCICMEEAICGYSITLPPIQVSLFK